MAGSKRKSPEHRAEMAARAERRELRRDRQLARAANRIAMRELANRIAHEFDPSYRKPRRRSQGAES